MAHPSPGEERLAQCLHQMIGLPGGMSEFAMVQEWVDFDFELRLFMFPPPGWKARRYLSRAARGLCGGTKGVAVTGSPRAGGRAARRGAAAPAGEL
jgi:hypothetical protein